MFPSLRSDVVVPAAGIDFVPVGLNNFSVTEPGGKCIHGVYIPSNQEDQDGSDFCDVCTSLKKFCKVNNLTRAEAELRTYCFQNYPHEEALKEIQRRLYGRPETGDSDNLGA